MFNHRVQDHLVEVVGALATAADQAMERDKAIADVIDSLQELVGATINEIGLLRKDTDALKRARAPKPQPTDEWDREP